MIECEVKEMNFREEINRYQEDMLNDLNTLVQVESTRDLSTAAEHAPFGKNCRKVLDHVLAIGQRDGFQTEDIDGYAGLITYGQGTETFGILGHMDIVPIGDDWTKEPLQVTLKDGYLFGRGVLDDKGPFMAAYYAVKMIRDLHIPLKKRIMMIAGCDEESGMSCIEYYKKHAEIPQTGFVPDADFPVIYGEKGGLHVSLKSHDHTVIEKLNAGSRPNIVIGKADCYVKTISPQQRKLFDFYCAANHIQGTIKETEGSVQLHIDGVFSHAAMPWLGINAAMHLLNYVGIAYGDQLANDLYSILYDWQGKPMDLCQNGMYMGFLTLNVGMIRMENDETSVLLDIRYPNDTNAQEIMDHINQACEALPSKVEAHLDSDMVPLFVDPDSDLVNTLMDAYRKYTGDTFSCPITIGGGTYARMLDHFVSYGPVMPREQKTTDDFVGGCHQRDEGIKLDDLLTAAAIYAEAIVRLCQ
jgi:succinyl-diaminopimelate desuccinylase